MTTNIPGYPRDVHAARDAGTRRRVEQKGGSVGAGGLGVGTLKQYYLLKVACRNASQWRWPERCLAEFLERRP